jgi:hypothetical protein
MRAILSAVCAIATMAPSHVQAVEYVWNSGTFSSQSIPSPLVEPDRLAMQTGQTKTFDVSFINQAAVSWLGGDVALTGNAEVRNSGLFDVLTDNLLTSSSPLPRFENQNLFRKSAGPGTTTIRVTFVNSGTLEAASGIIDYTSGNLAFNAGTSFIGAGVNRVSSNATFSADFDSTNLLLAGGTFNGIAASMGGAGRWTGGVLTGSWMVEDSATFAVEQGRSKTFNTAMFMNGGTVVWTADDLGFQAGTTVTNRGLWLAASDNSFSGSASTLRNSGTFLKSGATGVTTIGAGIRLVNSGVLEAQSGTIDYASAELAFNDGSSFRGAGFNRVSSNATFSGTFTSTNLLLTRGTFTGVGAVGRGEVAWSGGTLTGEWGVGSGATFRALAGGTKLANAAAVANRGTFLWEADNIGLQNATVMNAGVWEALSDNNLTGTGPTPSTFTNQGLLRKRAGTGTTTIAGGVNFTNPGTIEVQSGRLHLAQAWTNEGTVEVGAGAVFQVSGATLTNQGSIRGSGRVLAPAAGLDNRGRLSPGTSVGTLRIEGAVRQSPAGAIDIELGGLSFADLLQVAGTAALAGSLNVHRLAPYGPEVGDTFTILTATGGIRSTFDAVNFFGFPGIGFDVLYGANDVRLQVAFIPEAEVWVMLIAGLAMVGWVRLRRRDGE